MIDHSTGQASTTDVLARLLAQDARGWNSSRGLSLDVVDNASFRALFFCIWHLIEPQNRCQHANANADSGWYLIKAANVSRPSQADTRWHHQWCGVYYVRWYQGRSAAGRNCFAIGNQTARDQEQAFLRNRDAIERVADYRYQAGKTEPIFDPEIAVTEADVASPLRLKV